jgi:hypothetical protein
MGRALSPIGVLILLLLCMAGVMVMSGCAQAYPPTMNRPQVTTNWSEGAGMIAWVVAHKPLLVFVLVAIGVLGMCYREGGRS